MENGYNAEIQYLCADVAKQKCKRFVGDVLWEQIGALLRFSAALYRVDLFSGFGWPLGAQRLDQGTLAPS